MPGVFGGKSVSLECITGQSERSRADCRHFQASFEDILLHVILDVSHVQRIRDFLVMRYINVRTYLRSANKTARREEQETLGQIRYIALCTSNAVYVIALKL